MSNDRSAVNGVLGEMFLSLYDQPQKNKNVILIEKQIASG